MSLFVSFFVLVPKGVQGETRKCPRPPKSAHGGAQGYLKGNPGGAQGTQKGSWGICSGHGGGEAAGNWIDFWCHVSDACLMIVGHVGV